MMRVAIATDNGRVAGHFGRCMEYTVFEVEDGAVVDKQIIDSPGHQPGFLPRFLAEHAVDCIIAGGMGPRAQHMFSDREIDVVVGAAGAVDSVIEDFVSGSLETGEDQCDHI